MQAAGRNVAKHIGCEGLLDEVVAADPRAVPQYPVEDMAQRASISFIFRKNASQNRKQPAFFQKLQEQIGIAENGVHLRFQEKIFRVYPRVILIHGGETVGGGIVFHQAAGR